MRRFVALGMLAALACTVPAQAGDLTPARSRPGRHKAIGTVIGTAVGTVLGSYLSLRMVGDSGDAGAFFGLWTGFIAGGALAGYAAGGGFAPDLDVALEQGRERVSAARSAPLALRLTPIAGFDDLDFEDPGRRDGSRTAAAGLDGAAGSGDV